MSKNKTLNLKRIVTIPLEPYVNVSPSKEREVEKIEVDWGRNRQKTTVLKITLLFLFLPVINSKWKSVGEDDKTLHLQLGYKRVGFIS